MNPQVGQSLDGLSFGLCSTLCPYVSFRQEQFWVKFLKRVGGPIPQLAVIPNLWIWSLQVLSPLCWAFQLISSLWGPGNLLLSWHLGLPGGYPQFPIPHCYTIPFNFLTLWFKKKFNLNSIPQTFPLHPLTPTMIQK